MAELDQARLAAELKQATVARLKYKVDLETMKSLEPYICGSGNVFRAQVVGYFDQEGPDARIEAIIDASTLPPRIVFWRDLTHLGRGYPLESLGVEATSAP